MNPTSGIARDPALNLMFDALHRYDGYIVQSTGDGIFYFRRASRP